MDTRLQVAEKFAPLALPARYKVFYGGRGGAKSWTFAQELLYQALLRPLRVLCAREFQVSISDSVHKLLCDQITRLGWDGFYTVTKTQIRSVTGSEFIFKGLRHNAQEIKSLEGVDLCWCFVAGTLVDGKPIESIKAGDLVYSYNHVTGNVEKRSVIRCMKRKAPARLYRLIFDGSKSIIGTEEHPIFVKDRGYVPLSEIKEGDVVYACKTGFARNGSLPGRLRLHDRARYAWASPKICQERGNILQGLCPKNVIGENEEKQSNAEQRIPRKDDKDFAFERAQAYCTWWKRKRIHQSAKNTFKRAWQRVVAGVYCADRSLPRRERFANEFQGGHRKCLLWNCDRAGRGQSYGYDFFARRRKENAVLAEQRVDCIEIQKQTSLERFALSDGGNYVYNLEVEGNNNYFANGLLVHNCEEAQSVSRESWDLLIPTIRKEGSEIWISFNPGSPDDETYKRFVLNPPTDAVVVRVGWQDNPWFPDTLDKERLYCKAVDPEAYAHIWGGEPRTISDAQIFKGRFEVEAFETPSDARFFHGVDWGFAKDPTALVRMFVRDEVLYIDAEAYGVGVELDELPTLFDSIDTARKWPVKADAARPETISYMRRQGFNVSAAKKWAGSVLDGIALLKSFRKIVVHPCCPHTAEELRLYAYKVDKNNGDVLPVPMDAWNHCIDAARYALDGYIHRPGLNINPAVMLSQQRRLQKGRAYA